MVLQAAVHPQVLEAAVQDRPGHAIWHRQSFHQPGLCWMALCLGAEYWLLSGTLQSRSLSMVHQPGDSHAVMAPLCWRHICLCRMPAGDQLASIWYMSTCCRPPAVGAQTLRAGWS